MNPLSIIAGILFAVGGTAFAVFCPMDRGTRS